jgi:hypothetical protein
MNKLYVSDFSNIRAILGKKQQTLMSTPFTFSTTDNQKLQWTVGKSKSQSYNILLNTVYTATGVPNLNNVNFTHNAGSLYHMYWTWPLDTHFILRVYCTSVIVITTNFQNTKIRIYKMTVLLFVLRMCEMWSCTLREEHKFQVSGNKVLKKIFGPK